jgi:hypothetical protein
MKKIALVLVVILVLSLVAIPVSEATTAQNPPIENQQKEYVGIAPSMAETRWYIRNNNGVWEQRLWSVTFGRWLNDWHRIPGQM